MKFSLSPKRLLGNAFSRGSIIAALGGVAISAAMARERKRWHKKEPLIEVMTAEGFAHGGGKLLAGWLQVQMPDAELADYVHRCEDWLARSDEHGELDETPLDRARSRFLISKVLFVIEGFKLKSAEYELFQHEARQLLRQTPEWKDIRRSDVFTGKPFAPESMIGATHRLLWLSLRDKRELPELKAYLQAFDNAPAHDGADWMARLIARTFDATDDPKAFQAIMLDWFEAYRKFNLERLKKREKLLGDSLAIATGGLPFMAAKAAGKTALKQVWRKITHKK